MNLDQVKKVFVDNGFSQTNETKKALEYHSTTNEEYIYVKQEYPITCELRIVLHPKFAVVHGALSGEAAKHQMWHHSSSLRKFPKRLHEGKDPIHYGIAIELSSTRDLEAFLASFQNPSRFLV